MSVVRVEGQSGMGGHRNNRSRKGSKQHQICKNGSPRNYRSNNFKDRDK